MASRERIRVMVVDDHPVVLSGLAAALALDPGVEVVGEAASAEEALEQMPSLQPHVVLMDLVMPGMGGLEATARMRKTHPDVAVMLLTAHVEDGTVLEAVRRGARGYLRKDCPRPMLPAAVRVVRLGGSVLPWDVVERTSAQARPRPESAAPSLTEREIEILQALSKGATNREIADQLMIAVPTVKKSLQALMAKLGAVDRTQATSIAVRMGLID